MPNRIIREGILSSEKIAALAWPEEVFYRRLQSIVDDHGRQEANPQFLRSKCYPMHTDRQVDSKAIERWLAACQRVGLVICYDVSGKRYLEIVNFGQQKRSPSKFPEPSSDASKCSQGNTDAHLGVSGGEGVGKGEDEDGARKRAPSVDKFGLPEWLPPAEWEDFVEMRRAKGKRAPFTVGAVKGIIAELGRLRERGFDPAAVLQASINNGWSGVFPTKALPGTIQADDPAAWWTSRERILSKGAEFGLPAPPADDPQEFMRFKASVWVKAGEGPWWDDKDTAYPLAQRLRNGA